MGHVSTSVHLLALFDSGSAGTGEHGVGVGKKVYLEQELGRGTVNLMKTIKRAVDPMELFNPGKARAQLLLLILVDPDGFHSYIRTTTRPRRQGEWEEKSSSRRYIGELRHKENIIAVGGKDMIP